MDKYCADAVRFWAAGTKLGDDIPFQEKELQVANKTLTKLWNASKFALLNLSDYDQDWTGRFDELEVLDRWILSKCNQTIKEYTEAFESYEHSRAKFLIEQFFWDFCDNYLEIVKGRLYEPKDLLHKRSAQYTLEYCLKAILKLFAPILPFLTEEIYHLHFAKLEGKKSIHVSPLPHFRQEWVDQEAEIVGAEVVKIIEEVRRYKTTKQLAMNAPLEKLLVKTSVNLTLAENDLLSVTKAKQFSHEKAEETTVEIL
jgi:valyl-tRNA synthetase